MRIERLKHARDTVQIGSWYYVTDKMTWVHGEDFLQATRIWVDGTVGHFPTFYRFFIEKDWVEWGEKNEDL